MKGGAAFQGGVALGLALNVLCGDGVQGNVGNGIAGLVDHIGPAVFADLDGGDNIVQKGLLRHKIDHAHNLAVPASVLVKRRGHHDGQLACDFADQGLGHIDAALHGLLHIFPVRVVVSIKNADAVGSDDVAPLEAVHGDALVDDGALFLQRHLVVGQLRDAAGIHGHVFVGGQLLLNALCRQHRRLAHHLVHRGDGAPVAERAAGHSHRDQCDQDRGHQAYRDLFSNASHLFSPQQVMQICMSPFRELMPIIGPEKLACQ